MPPIGIYVSAVTLLGTTVTGPVYNLTLRSVYCKKDQSLCNHAPLNHCQYAAFGSHTQYVPRCATQWARLSFSQYLSLPLTAARMNVLSI